MLIEDYNIVEPEMTQPTEVETSPDWWENTVTTKTKYDIKGEYVKDIEIDRMVAWNTNGYWENKVYDFNPAAIITQKNDGIVNGLLSEILTYPIFLCRMGPDEYLSNSNHRYDEYHHADDHWSRSEWELDSPSVIRMNIVIFWPNYTYKRLPDGGLSTEVTMYGRVSNRGIIDGDNKIIATFSIIENDIIFRVLTVGWTEEKSYINPSLKSYFISIDKNEKIGILVKRDNELEEALKNAIELKTYPLFYKDGIYFNRWLYSDAITGDYQMIPGWDDIEEIYINHNMIDNEIRHYDDSMQFSYGVYDSSEYIYGFVETIGHYFSHSFVSNPDIINRYLLYSEIHLRLVNRSMQTITISIPTNQMFDGAMTEDEMKSEILQYIEDHKNWDNGIKIYNRPNCFFIYKNYVILELSQITHHKYPRNEIPTMVAFDINDLISGNFKKMIPINTYLYKYERTSTDELDIAPEDSFEGIKTYAIIPGESSNLFGISDNENLYFPAYTTDGIKTGRTIAIKKSCFSEENKREWINEIYNMQDEIGTMNFDESKTIGDPLFAEKYVSILKTQYIPGDKFYKKDCWDLENNPKPGAPEDYGGGDPLYLYGQFYTEQTVKKIKKADTKSLVAKIQELENAQATEPETEPIDFSGYFTG